MSISVFATSSFVWFPGVREFVFAPFGLTVGLCADSYWLGHFFFSCFFFNCVGIFFLLFTRTLNKDSSGLNRGLFIEGSTK